MISMLSASAARSIKNPFSSVFYFSNFSGTTRTVLPLLLNHSSDWTLVLKRRILKLWRPGGNQSLWLSIDLNFPHSKFLWLIFDSFRIFRVVNFLSLSKHRTFVYKHGFKQQMIWYDYLNEMELEIRISSVRLSRFRSGISPPIKHSRHKITMKRYRQATINKNKRAGRKEEKSFLRRKRKIRTWLLSPNQIFQFNNLVNFITATTWVELNFSICSFLLAPSMWLRYQQLSLKVSWFPSNELISSAETSPSAVTANLSADWNSIYFQCGFRYKLKLAMEYSAARLDEYLKWAKIELKFLNGFGGSKIITFCSWFDRSLGVSVDRHFRMLIQSSSFWCFS